MAMRGRHGERQRGEPEPGPAGQRPAHEAMRAFARPPAQGTRGRVRFFRMLGHVARTWGTWGGKPPPAQTRSHVRLQGSAVSRVMEKLR